MRHLVDAPVIVDYWHPGDRGNGWIQKAADETRKRFNNPPEDQKDLGLMKLAEDIWACKGGLGLHKDPTRRGFRVLGLVLINECDLRLATGDTLHKLPVGTLYHIDGRAPHGALLPDDGAWAEGIFGFMAWDIHRHSDLDEILDSIPDAMKAYTAGEHRIDVSTAARDI